MLGEIGNGCYCSADDFRKGICHNNPPSEHPCFGLMGKCKYCHRKHPTPEQFRDEYGEEVTNDTPVWVNGWFENGNSMYADGEYRLMAHIEAMQMLGQIGSIKKWVIVCACTPFGNPDKDWRP